MTHVHASQVFPVLLLALAPTATSFAQALDQDFCRPVLDIGAREESFTRLAWQSAQHLYDNACSKDQVNRRAQVRPNTLVKIVFCGFSYIQDFATIGSEDIYSAFLTNFISA